MTWISLTKETTAATQESLEELIGLSRRTFNASAFLAQENSGAFTKADPSERKQVLGSILDHANIWPRLWERAKTERGKVEAALLGTEAKMAEREQIAIDAPILSESRENALAEQSEAKRSADDGDETLTVAQAALAASAAAAERTRAAEQAHASATREAERARTELAAADARAGLLVIERGRLLALEPAANRIGELEAATETQRAASADREQLILRKQTAEREYRSASSAADRAIDEVQTLADEHNRTIDCYNHLRTSPAGSEHCALCHQTLGAEARDDSLKEYEKLLAAIAEQKTAKQSEAQTLAAKSIAACETADAITVPEPGIQVGYSRQLADARAAKEERAALAVTIANIEDAAGKIPALTEAVTAADLALEEAAVALLLAKDATGDQEALERAVTDARLSISLARETLDRANAQVTRLDEQLTRARTAAQELDELRALTDGQHTMLRHLRAAERAYHRDGIPALIAENIIPTIEVEANRILERLPTSAGTVFRIEMRTQRELKSGDALKETLDILVSDRATTREFGTFSGGERFRVSFALRWALAKLLRNRRGAQSDILVIDEPDGLDAGGMDGLAEILREEAGAFASVLLVSHNPLLASAFEQSVSLVSDGEVSRLAA